jgi:voltage-gated potassium channel Kch
VLAIDDVDASVRTAELVRKHFPHLKIFARARNRQHAFRLMDLGVEHVVRETFGSSLEMSVEVLQALGLSKLKAQETAQRFRLHDEATLLRQHALKDDEKKLIQSGTGIRPTAAATVRNRRRRGAGTACPYRHLEAY